MRSRGEREHSWATAKERFYAFCPATYTIMTFSVKE
uniref:Uncharacterized protein n=1 Tax=Anguilla anguilla TaxID=7936 RepID=A0A0E9USF5_ANGAN